LSELQQILSQETPFSDWSFSPDSQQLAIASGKRLRRWDLAQSQWVATGFEGDTECDLQVTQVAFSPDGQLIATNSLTSDIDSDISHMCLRNLNGQQLARYVSNGFDEIRFSDDSSVFFSVNYEGQVNKVWRIESFAELMTQGCDLVHEYLQAPGADINERDRKLCD